MPADQVESAAILKYYRVINIDDTEGIQIQLPEIQIKVGNELKIQRLTSRAGWNGCANDKKFIFEASAKAQKAVDYILNHTGE